MPGSLPGLGILPTNLAVVVPLRVKRTSYHKDKVALGQVPKGQVPIRTSGICIYTREQGWGQRGVVGGDCVEGGVQKVKPHVRALKACAYAHTQLRKRPCTCT